jgi:hypothetical protein
MLVLLCLTAAAATPALAVPLQVTFGMRIDRLQDFVDRRYGKNRIDVRKDFIGARTGEIDPWFWVGDRIGVVRVRLLKRDASGHHVGWYVEDGAAPGQPGDGGALSFSSGRTRQDAIVALPGMRTRFGFYLEARETSEESGEDDDRRNGDYYGNGEHGNDEHGNDGHGNEHARGPWKKFFTNRKLNDCGPDGRGAVHAPFDGDVQALVFDVSRWAGTDTWLVCFEDRDSGATPDREVVGADSDDDEERDGDARRRCRASDNDYDDVILEVGAEGATPARALTFGALKLIYR